MLLLVGKVRYCRGDVGAVIEVSSQVGRSLGGLGRDAEACCCDGRAGRCKLPMTDFCLLFVCHGTDIVSS